MTTKIEQPVECREQQDPPERIWIVRQTSDGYCKSIWFPAVPRLIPSEQSEAVEYVRATRTAEAEQNQRIRERLGWSEGDLLNGKIKSYEELRAENARLVAENGQRGKFLEYFHVKVEPFYEKKHGKPLTIESGSWELLAFVENALASSTRETAIREAAAIARQTAIAWGTAAATLQNDPDEIEAVDAYLNKEFAGQAIEVAILALLTPKENQQ